MIMDTSMFLDDWEMLECRLEAFGAIDAVHIIVEAPMSHRGEPKPLHLLENPGRWRRWTGRIVPVAAHGLPAGEGDHWGREHAQRNAAWPTIARWKPEDSSPVLICDGDEIPSRALLEHLPRWAATSDTGTLAIPMRTCLFAVDWEAIGPLPPTCVAATAGHIRKRAGGDLARVRDGRNSYPRFEGDGGWHLSWIGGPEAQRDKLLKTTCHTELLDSAEGELIASGERWRTASDGGGIPVKAVDVDESWPAYVRERRCPESWYRPREAA
jgi:hypothetical protein